MSAASSVSHQGRTEANEAGMSRDSQGTVHWERALGEGTRQPTVPTLQDVGTGLTLARNATCDVTDIENDTITGPDFHVWHG